MTKHSSDGFPLKAMGGNKHILKQMEDQVAWRGKPYSLSGVIWAKLITQVRNIRHPALCDIGLII